jgi:RNA polymerase sigma-B factor
VDQIAQHLGTSSEAVLEAMEASYSYTPASLDAPGREDEETSEPPSVETGYEAALNRAWLQSVLPALDPDEQLVIRRLYFDGETQRSIGTEMNVSQMQISRIHARALQRLRVAADGSRATAVAQ